MAFPDGGGVLIAQREEVKELPHIEQGFNIILKSMVSNPWEEDIGYFRHSNRRDVQATGGCGKTRLIVLVIV